MPSMGSRALFGAGKAVLDLRFLLTQHPRAISASAQWTRLRHVGARDPPRGRTQWENKGGPPLVFPPHLKLWSHLPLDVQQAL